MDCNNLREVFIEDNECIIANCKAAVIKSDVVAGNLTVTDKRIIFNRTQSLNSFQSKLLYGIALNNSATVPDVVRLKDINCSDSFSFCINGKGFSVITKSGFSYKYILLGIKHDNSKRLSKKMDLIIKFISGKKENTKEP